MNAGGRSMFAVAEDQMCIVEGCRSRRRSKGLCHGCYQAQRRGRKLEIKCEEVEPAPVVAHRVRALKVCNVEGCTNRAHARLMCKMHYNVWWRGEIPSEYVPPAEREHEVRDVDDERGLMRNLDRARKAYACAVGWQTRLFWKREFESLEARLKALGEKI